MKLSQNDKIIYGVVAIIIVALVVTNIPELNINVPSGDSGSPDYIPPEINITPPDTSDVPAPPPPTGIEPTSLMVSFDDVSITMGDTLYGTVVSNGKDYPITIHGLHVGANIEQTYGGLLGDNGKFYDSNVMEVPGYWDFWATTSSVTSNKPRVTVEGAMLVSSKTSFSRTFGSTVATIQFYCHSSGSALFFFNDPDAGTSTPIENVYINSGGYGTTTLDVAGWSLGYYELDFVVNGIKASDYGESVEIFLGR